MKMTLTSKPPGAKAPNLNVRHRRSLLLMQFTGTLKFWNDGRGFGFIEPTYSGQGILVVDPRQQPPPITAQLAVPGAAAEAAHGRAGYAGVPAGAIPSCAVKLT